MFGILASSVIGFMLQGCLCTEWSIKMPGNITAVSGSCIVIPCTFTLPAKYNAKLNNSTVLWSRGLIGGPTVLSSNKQLASDFGGEIVGDFKSKNCTTVFTNLPQGFSEPLLFRVEGPNEVKYTYSKELFISFQRGSLPPPELSMSPPGELRAGKTLTLTCRARDPCPSLPPEVKIDPEMGSSQVESFLQVDSEQGVRFVTATQSFTMKPIHHGRNVTCQAIYPRRDGGKSYGEVESLTLNILYGPHNTRVMMSLPSPVPVGKLVTLRCHSEANPAVTSYKWWTENKGHLVLRATGQELVLMATWADKGLYACEATNPYGQEKSAVVALEVESGIEGQQCSMLPYIICGVLAFLYVLTVAVDVYKYKRLIQTLKTQETLSEPYATLALANISPDYEQIQQNVRRMPGTENVCTERRQRPA